MTLGKPIRTRGLVVGGVEYVDGDTLLAFGDRLVLLGQRGDLHTVAWNDDKGVPLRWSDADKTYALRNALFVAEHGRLLPSASRKSRTLRNLTAVAV